MAPKSSQTNLFEHSEAKVRLLSEYLKRYLSIISNDGYTEKIRVYDLFCGPGIFENEGEGSPLVILRTINDLHFMNVAKLEKFPKIECFFNDIDAEKIVKLKSAIESKSLHYSEFCSLQYSSEDYEEKIGKILVELKSAKKQKSFIFIDPYGYQNIKASQIKELLETENTEVLLFLPTQFMYRFDMNGTPVALKDFIEEIVPYKEWRSTDSVWKFIEQLKESFRNFLASKYFVDTFTIQKDVSTVFCLFFFCNHIKGFEKMLESKWEIDTEQGKGWSYTDSSDSLFEDHKTNLLEEKLLNHIQAESRNNAEIYEFVLRNGFLPKHANEVFYNLQKQNKLKVSSPQEKVRKGAFYISYEYYKPKSKRVIFTIG